MQPSIAATLSQAIPWQSLMVHDECQADESSDGCLDYLPDPVSRLAITRKCVDTHGMRAESLLLAIHVHQSTGAGWAAPPGLLCPCGCSSRPGAHVRLPLQGGGRGRQAALHVRRPQLPTNPQLTRRGLTSCPACAAPQSADKPSIEDTRIRTGQPRQTHLNDSLVLTRSSAPPAFRSWN